jgi:hypothetical protein
MAKQQGRPGDFTGIQKAKLAQQHAEDVAAREGELAMMEAAEAEAAKNRVTDYSGGASHPVVIEDPDVVAEAELLLQREGHRDQGSTDDDVQILDAEGVVAKGPETRLIRVNSDLKDVTIGAGNLYTFLEGEKYRVPMNVADHLEEKGYVWH